jgi:hypothetical protein
MNENEKNLTTEETEENDYIQAINDLKANTVDKAQYEKLKAENKKLLDSLISGQTPEITKPVEKPNVNELRKELFNPENNLSNLEYVENMLKLRNALIENGERDPFLPIGEKVEITSDTVEKAQNVANLLQDCVDMSKGDSGIFTAELQRIMKDNGPIKRGR